MKTKTICLHMCMLLLCILAITKATCQQSEYVKPASPAAQQMPMGNDNYTYKLFIAPNKQYGYDILKNGKLIFHQPAMPEPVGNKEAALNKKPLAEKAALLAIEKIKKGMPAELTRQEVKQITAQ